MKRENEDDPYDLKVVDYKHIKETENNKLVKKDQEKNNSLREYYTISRKGLCHYVNGKPLEFIPLYYWLKERENYDQIKALKFFTKFRKWKTLKMWKKNVIKHKNAVVENILQEKLFMLNPIMRNTLRNIRKNTFDM